LTALFSHEAYKCLTTSCACAAG